MTPLDYTPILALTAVALVGFLAYVLAIHRNLARQRERIDQAWLSLCALLRERHAAILEQPPGALDTRALSESLLAALPENPVDAAKIEARLEAALAAVSETAPPAPSRLVELNKRISDLRALYNAGVERFNARIDVFPDSIIAGALDLEERPLFLADNPPSAPKKRRRPKKPPSKQA